MVALAFVALALLSSCVEPDATESTSTIVSDDERVASRDGRIISVGDVTVLVSEWVAEGMASKGGGRLEVVGGCLGANGSVIVWPHGTAVIQEQPLTISIPENGTFTLGDEVEIGGGYVLEHSSRQIEPGDFPVGDIKVPEECAKHDVFWAY